METTELLVLPELQVVINQSQLPVSKAQAHAIQLAPYMAKINELTQPLAGMDKTNPTPEQAKMARETRLKMVPNRTDAGRKKDELKADLLIEANLIDGLFKVIENSSKLTESEYASIEKFEENRLNEVKAKLKTDRLALLTPLDVPGLEFFQLDVMPDDQFKNLLVNAQAGFEARKLAAEKAEADRLQAEKEAEAARIEADRLQAERIENERLEAIKIKAEKDALEKQEQERQKKEIKRIEAEKVKVAQFSHRLENHGFVCINPDADFGAKKYQKLEFSVVSGQMTLMSEGDISELILSAQKAEQKEIELQVEREAAKAEADKLAKQAADKLAETQRLAKIESDKQADLIAKQKAEADKLQAELKAKKDEANRIEAERIASEKAALSAPDKDKINALYMAIKAIALPDLKTPEYAAIGQLVIDGLNGVLNTIKVEAGKLK